MAPSAASSDVPDATPLDTSSTPEDQFEGAVPPGYDWPTHGGYLGCLLGSFAALLIGGFLGTSFFAVLSYTNVVPFPLTLLGTAVVFLVCFIGLGRLGWYLGKRFYREYHPSQPTWGEDDAYEHERDAATPEDTRANISSSL